MASPRDRGLTVPEQVKGASNGGVSKAVSRAVTELDRGGLLPTDGPPHPRRLEAVAS